MKTKYYVNGIFETSCTLYGKPLKYMPYATACVNTLDDGSIELQSYKTSIIKIDKNGWLSCTGTYSATTRKHINAFMREYTNLSYYDAKMCYEKNKKINIYTKKLKTYKKKKRSGGKEKMKKYYT